MSTPQGTLPPSASSALPPPHAPPELTSISPAAARALDIASSTALVAAPILLLVPPRKLDLYTLSLGTLWVASAEHQVRARSGRSLLQWAGLRAQARQRTEPAAVAAEWTGDAGRYIARPEAEEWREMVGKVARLGRTDLWAVSGARLGCDGQRRARTLAGLEDFGVESAGVSDVQSGAFTAEGVAGLARSAWYGGEQPASWKAKRLREEREAEEEGLGVGDRILAQIWAVWNQAHLEADAAEGEKGGEGGSGSGTREG